ncbi:MAG: hypothetical protein WC100_05820 [Sterolibacterium sp.]
MSHHRRFLVAFDDRKQGVYVDAFSSTDAAQAAAGLRARSARFEASYDGGAEKRGYDICSVLMDDRRNRRCTVRMVGGLGPRTHGEAPMRRVLVTLDEASIETAKSLADGNLSAGIRAAINRAK